MTQADRREPFQPEEASIADIHAALRSGHTDCVRLVRHYLARIRAYSEAGPGLNAFVTLNPKAIEEAARLDRELAHGSPLRALHGVVVTLKDSIDTADMPTTVGSALLRDSVPREDAPLVARLREAGAIILGKNVLGDLSGASYSTVAGIPRNPHDTRRMPGGSSSGCGVAVSANLTTVAVGEDTFTSVRTPAALTGVVGFRPTTGLISARGIAPRKVGIDTAGPIARTVADAARLLDVIAGPDPADALSVRTFGQFAEADRCEGRYRPFASGLDRASVQGVRIGIGRDFFGGDPEIDRLAEAALRRLEQLGADLVDVRFDPAFFDRYVRHAVDTLMPLLMRPFRARFEAYLATRDEGTPKTVEAWLARYETDLAASRFPPEATRPTHAIRVLRDSLEYSSNDPDYRQLIEKTLPMLTREKRAVFDAHRVSALVMPYQPMFAEPIVTPLDSIEVPEFVRAPHITPPNSIAGYGSEGFPMAVVPMGFGSLGLPMGLAFMGLPCSDHALLGYAHAFEQATRHRRAPASAPTLPAE